MKINLFNTEKVRLMKKALDIYQKQNKAIAQNVANASNPNYYRTKTDFSNVLKSVSSQSNLKVTDERHITSSRFNIVATDDKQEAQNVDITREMAELAENQIRHEFVSRGLGGTYGGLKKSISGKY